MKKNNNKNTVRVMIGEGEHATFVNVKKGEKVMVGEGENSIFIEAGLTVEESRKRINDKIDKLPDVKIPKQKVKQKILNFKK